jgi:hypothetical protein
MNHLRNNSVCMQETISALEDQLQVLGTQTGMKQFCQSVPIAAEFPGFLLQRNWK